MDALCSADDLDERVDLELERSLTGFKYFKLLEPLLAEAAASRQLKLMSSSRS
jgi:hypothetical protein